MSDSSKQLGRRKVIKYGGAASVFGLTGRVGASSTEKAQEFPSQEMEWVIPYSEGGGTDTIARGVSPGVSDVLGVDITINNIPAAGGMQAVGQLYTGEPDGYTIGATNPPAIPSTVIAREPGFFEEPSNLLDLEPVASLARTPYVLAADADHEIEGPEDLLSRFESGELSTIGGSSGAAPFYLSLRDVAGIQVDEFIIYGGTGDAARAAAGGEVDCALGAETGVQAAVEEDLVDPIMALPSDGSFLYPDIPTVPDATGENIDFTSQTIRTYHAPPETPEDRIQTIADGIEEGMQTETVQEWAEETGNELEYWGPDRVGEEYESIFNGITENLDVEELSSILGE